MAQQGEKERISVVAFDNATQVKDSTFVRGLLEALGSEFSKIKKYQYVERAQLETLMGETKLAMEGLTNDSYAQLGQLASLDLIVIGNITRINEDFKESSYKDKQGKTHSSYSRRTEVEVGVKIVEPKTGTVKFSETAKGNDGASIDRSTFYSQSRNTNTGLYSKLAREAIGKIMKRIGIGSEATVLQVKDKLVMIDMGSNDGVIKGTRFVIIAEGDPIIHPGTGEVIAVDEITVAYITIEEIAAATSKGRVSNRQKGEKDDGKRGKIDIKPGMTARQIDTSEGLGSGEKIKGFFKDLI